MGDVHELQMVTDENYNTDAIPHASPVIRLENRRQRGRRVTRFRVPDVTPVPSKSDSKSTKSSRRITQVLESSTQLVKSTKSSMFGALNDITERMRSSLHLPPLMSPIRSPLSFETYLNHLDYSGRIINLRKYKHDIFSRGFDPRVRIDIWRMILHVFPSNASIYVRDQYMADLSEDYYRLKVEWLLMVQSNKLHEKVMCTFAQIKGDVDRTDRNITFFGGSEGQARTVQLYEMLCMYIHCHPSVAYRQGMADFAGVMLYVQRDEAKAYMCFCALMERLSRTFCDSSVILRQMEHLQQLLTFFDPSLEALINANKVELLFGPLYRWLMLEMKREFSFEESLRLLEVQWVMVRHHTSHHHHPGVKLTDASFESPNSHSSRSNVQKWLMGQSELTDSGAGTSPSASSASNCMTMDSWLSVLSSETATLSEHHTSKEAWEARSTASSQKVDDKSAGPTPGEILLSSTIESRHTVANYRQSTFTRSCEVRSNHIVNKTDTRRATRSFRTNTIPTISNLGAGNPFLIFLCIALLIENRDKLLHGARSGDVIGTFTAVFQSGTCKHNVDNVLSRAYYLFKLYIHELKKVQCDSSGLDDIL